MAGSSNGDRSGPDRGRGRSRGPIDQWFEVFVYAPLGFALDARQLFPRFVDRGRSQVVLARVIGKYAVKHGSSMASDRIEQSQTQIAAVLQTLGWLPEEHEQDDAGDVEAFEADAVVFHDEPAPRPDEAATTPAAAEAASGPEADTDVDRLGRAGSDPASSTSSGAGEPEAPAPASTPDVVVGDLAIPDYDNLSASQVVPRLAGLSAVELEAVRRYEASGRGRKTILSKIAQLQAA